MRSAMDFLTLCLFPSHAWCRGPPSPVYNQFWHDLLQRLGYCWTREVRWLARWLLYSGPMRYHYVRCHIAHYLQKRSQLAPWPRARLRKHSHCFMWKQGRRQGGRYHIYPFVTFLTDVWTGTQSQNGLYNVPQEEKSPIFWNFGQVKFQFWKAFPLAGKKTGRVSCILPIV